MVNFSWSNTRNTHLIVVSEEDFVVYEWEESNRLSRRIISVEHYNNHISQYTRISHHLPGRVPTIQVQSEAFRTKWAQWGVGSFDELPQRTRE